MPRHAQRNVLAHTPSSCKLEDDTGLREVVVVPVSTLRAFGSEIATGACERCLCELLSLAIRFLALVLLEALQLSPQYFCAQVVPVDDRDR